MSDRKGKNKKRKKSYYIKCAHKKPKRENDLGEDMKGFLVTCNSNEKQAVREMYNILNEYADKLYGPEELKKDDADESGSDDEEDMEEAMNKEIQAMKEKTPAQRRFQNVSTKAKNCIFIRTLIEDPRELMINILSDLETSGIQKTRFAIRALPIQGTCKAHITDIEKLSKLLLKKDFETPFGTGLNFSIVFKSRNNNSIGRVSVIPAVAQIVNDFNALHKVNHGSPDVVILIEIVGTVCCLSVLKDFYKFKKYNLQEVVKPKPQVVSAESQQKLDEPQQILQQQQEVVSAKSQQQFDKPQQQQQPEQQEVVSAKSQQQFDEPQQQQEEINTDQEIKQTEIEDKQQNDNTQNKKDDSQQNNEEIDNNQNNGSKNKSECGTETNLLSDNIDKSNKSKEDET